MRECPYLSNLAFVAWLSGVMTDANWLNSVFWYSWSDDGGDSSFEMAQESKKLAFDDHSVKSLLSLSFCSSLASEGWKICQIIFQWCSQSSQAYWWSRCKTSEWRRSPTHSSSRQHSSAHWKAKRLPVFVCSQHDFKSLSPLAPTNCSPIHTQHE